MRLGWGSASDVGLTRRVNEDAFVAGPDVFAVADGLGGHSAGDVASGIAVAQIGRAAAAPGLRPEDLRDAVQSANLAILAAAARHADRRGMGTTVTGVARVHVADVEQLAVFNVGDSRVYRYADGELEQLTVDHSEVEEMVRRGSITRAQARTHPLRNVVTRSLGATLVVAPDIWVIAPGTGDRFVVCSDGLTSELDDDAIAVVLRGCADPQGAADRLIALARDAGGHDNITAVVIDVLDGDGDQPRASRAMPSRASTVSRTRVDSPSDASPTE
jgi:protein phosphatase